jgi:hypothetical protein
MRLPAAISLPARRTPCPGIASASTCGIGPDRSTESESSTQSQPSGMASPASTQTGDVVNDSGEYDDAPTRSRAPNA